MVNTLLKTEATVTRLIHCNFYLFLEFGVTGPRIWEGNSSRNKHRIKWRKCRDIHRGDAIESRFRPAIGGCHVTGHDTVPHCVSHVAAAGESVLHMAMAVELQRDMRASVAAKADPQRRTTHTNGAPQMGDNGVTRACTPCTRRHSQAAIANERTKAAEHPAHKNTPITSRVTWRTPSTPRGTLAWPSGSMAAAPKRETPTACDRLQRMLRVTSANPEL